MIKTDRQLIERANAWLIEYYKRFQHKKKNRTTNINHKATEVFAHAHTNIAVCIEMKWF